MLFNKILVLVYLLFFQFPQETEIQRKIAVAPMIYEQAYEYADIVYTENKTVTILWRFDSFGTLQPFVANVQYSADEPKPVICRNSDEYPEVIIVYESRSISRIDDKVYYIDVFRYCPINREIREIVVKDKGLKIPHLTGALRNVINQNFAENIDSFTFTKQMEEIYSEDLGFEP